MPTYQYECQACGYFFDELQAMTDAKLTKCPKCQKNKLTRLIGGGSGIIFKNDSPNPAASPARPCGGSCACHP